MLTFALAVLLLIATPGPGVLSTAGVGAAFGWRPGLSYVRAYGRGLILYLWRLLRVLRRLSSRCRWFGLFCYLPRQPIWDIWRCALRWLAARSVLLPPQSRLVFCLAFFYNSSIQKPMR